MSEQITGPNTEDEPSLFHQQLCCRLREKIKANSKDKTKQLGVHIHNYSLTAAKYFIAEVKKYPIIYVTTTSNLPYTNAFINFAWSKIVASLMTDEIESNMEKRLYWEKSFQVLWNWMRWVFEKDMLQRSRQAIHARSVAQSWLSHLRFLEPYMRLRGSSDINNEMNSGISIHMKSVASQLNTNAEASCTYWLNHPDEPNETTDIYISICIRNPIDLCSNSDWKEHSGLALEPTSSNRIIEDLLDPVDFTDILSTQSNSPSSPTSSLNLQPFLPFEDMLFENPAIEENNPLPPLNSGQILIDEDFDYIMSFLPLLKQFEPEKKTKVKVMLIKAMSEDL